MLMKKFKKHHSDGGGGRMSTLEQDMCYRLDPLGLVSRFRMQNLRL